MGRDAHEKDSHAVNCFELVYDRHGIVRELSLISSKVLYEKQEPSSYYMLWCELPAFFSRR